jgi:hypothetical protein
LLRRPWLPTYFCPQVFFLLTSRRSSVIINASRRGIARKTQDNEFQMFNAFAMNNIAPVAIMVPAMARALDGGTTF